MSFLNDKKILVTGGGGFLGTRVVAALRKAGVASDNIAVPQSEKYDLRLPEACKEVVQGMDVVIHLAAAVGGIGFNRSNPARAFYDNAMMALNMIESSYRAGVKKFVGIGSVCEYPKFAPTPFREEDLWNGYPEETNAPYGLAKKIMLVQTQAYRAQYGFNGIHLLMVNLYGPGDNFNPETAHVVPGIIGKVLEAKESGKDYVEIWGTGKATREFLYVEDAAEGIVLATEHYNDPAPVNLGSGTEVPIKEIAEMICRLLDFNGEIRWDTSRPDGQPRRLLDVNKAKKEFGFAAKTKLEDGLRTTIDWYLKTR